MRSAIIENLLLYALLTMANLACITAVDGWWELPNIISIVVVTLLFIRALLEENLALVKIKNFIFKIRK